MNSLETEIRDGSEIREAPNGKEYRSLPSLKIHEIAHRHRCSLREVEIRALRNHVVPERYQRNLGSIGMEGQARLLESKVAVVGVGGLGGVALDLLLRVGVGEIVLIDGDAFLESNLNRQLLSNMTNIGLYKVEVARQRAEAVNPSTKIETYRAWANKETLEEMIKGSQVVLDGLDDIPTRHAVEGVARRLGIPFVHGAVAGFWGEVMTVFPEDRGLSLIYGSQTDPAPGDEKELGTPCVTPTVVASLQVSEVIKVLLGWQDTIRNRLLVLNLKNSTTGFVDLV